MPFDIAVVGSINHDITVLADRLPIPGETVLGSEHFSANGGKGANQAVAAARLGSSVAMFGRVGDDEYGEALTAALEHEGIDTAGVSSDGNVPTGLAVITVDSSAENTIVVSPGANQALMPHHLEAHTDAISNSAVVLAQLEVPLETVLSACKIGGGIVCLNPAPAQALPSELLDLVDVLIPNRSELAAISGVEEPHSPDEVGQAAKAIDFAGAVVVTLGAEGAMIFDSDEAIHVAAPAVRSIDPTGAGDAFCGAVAHGLSHGATLETAVRLAVAVGALAATGRGAQPSMPGSDDVEGFLDSL